MGVEGDGRGHVDQGARFLRLDELRPKDAVCDIACLIDAILHDSVEHGDGFETQGRVAGRSDKRAVHRHG